MSVDPRVCAACGARDDEPLLAGGATGAGAGAQGALRCRACGEERAFLRQPLLCLTGPSGSGKSTVAAAAAPQLADRLVTLEQDVLWEPELAEVPGGVRRFRRTWLRLAAMVGQNGRPVLLCGTVAPAELEALPERALFGDVRYLALVAAPDVLAARLRARPAWRGWDEGRIAETLAFAEDLRAGRHCAGAPLELLDVTGATLDQTVADVVAWAEACLAAAPA